MTLAEAKLRLPIHTLWKHFNFPGELKKTTRCPFHDDTHESFSVDPTGTLWNCFAGCGGGDSVDFYERATQLPHRDACRAFTALAGGSCTPPRRPVVARDTDTDKASNRKRWPEFLDPLTGQQCTAWREDLCKLRTLSAEGVRLAAERGLLHFCAWKSAPAWVITDSARVNAQARRLDGQPWPAIGAKAQTLPGSLAAWPIGTHESKPYPVILLVEGGPDLLTGFHFIHAHRRAKDTAVVAVLGASNVLASDSVALFAGKRVRIMVHADDAGRNAAEDWTKQLRTVGATVDAADFNGLRKADGTNIKDLNDLTSIDPKQSHEIENLIPQ